MEICIIAPLRDSNPTYSIVSVIKAQSAVLAAHKHKVTIIVNEDFTGPGIPGATLLKILPSIPLFDYKSKLNISKEHEDFATNLATILSPRLARFDIIFTHDLIFTGLNLPYALAIMVASAENENLTWYHWVHSFPFITRDWWDMQHYTGNHYVVYPITKPAKYIGEVFNTNKVIHIPHIIDLKNIYRFSDQTKDIIDLLPALQSADIVQVYPAATDRFESKGVRELTNLFGLLKRSGRSVCLVIANQFSGRREARLVDPIYYYEKVARRCGLEPYSDYIFTSELFNGKYSNGMPQRVLLELMTLSNLFVIPSKSESFGLGLFEALMASSVICVANEHLDLPIKQFTSFDFKAINSVNQFIDINDMAPLVDWIIEALDTNSSIKARTIIRQQFNPVAIYNNYYKALLSSIPILPSYTAASSSYLDF